MARRIDIGGMVASAKSDSSAAETCLMPGLAGKQITLATIALSTSLRGHEQWARQSLRRSVAAHHERRRGAWQDGHGAR